MSREKRLPAARRSVKVKCAVEALQIYRSLDRNQRNTFIACFLGWTLDALDFFLLTFVVKDVAAEFSVSIVKVTFAITLTLMMRPLGALIFGLLGDRFGRRIPLMVDIIFYSLMELLTAFSPSYTVFLIFRALYGVGMGGEWGLGASLAMESLPARARGLASGVLQQGYSFGFLLAAVVYWLVFPHFGWRALFVVGALPALARDLHPGARAGVGGLGAAALDDARVVRHGAVHEGALAALHLRRPPDDGFQLHVARHPGSLPDLSPKTARPFGQSNRADCDHLQSGRDLRRDVARPFFANAGGGGAPSSSPRCSASCSSRSGFFPRRCRS